MSNTGPYASLPMHNSEMEEYKKSPFPCWKSMSGMLCMHTGVFPHAVPIPEDAETFPSNNLLLPKKEVSFRAASQTLQGNIPAINKYWTHK